MKAAIWTAYGTPDVLQVQEVDKPIPKDNEVLIRIAASTVTAGDSRMRRCDVPSGFWLPSRLAFGLFKPRKTITGMDFSGEVVAVGKGVSLFKTGDRVFGSTGMALGTNAEYTCIAENKSIINIPNSISHTDAVALIFGGITALHFLTGRIKQGSKVLINGASGSVGSAAVQLAKSFGAEITGICSGGNRDLVLSLGADKVIDYTKNEFANDVVVYDVILDAVGNLSYAGCKKSLSKSGILILINAGLGTIISSLFNRQVICGVAVESKERLHEILRLYESKQLMPVIDKTYPLEKIAEAHRHVDTGHKKGNVVITTE
ncbi:NAD(P)-dependent alcohol dehydrogenase [Simiduia aestuariiviva]|uniref:NADPH:quinone reductase-like Zn-dependent oxidoreductase n=1 Tax=Simiduia aestuariiviva TaxID=1510459 RepID=A0A839UHR7_9GAMM|nr:NAD(P)-dependent alcohol dehydrogenase [Simiduia aestuariiviva]MBB3167402.1 NADPH:quinone reductase-like Zn-dependent oxidoreductase [Simiduia aestuariiviva]